MRIDSSGNLLIGRTAWVDNHFDNGIYLAGSTQAGMKFMRTASGSSGTYDIGIDTDNAFKFVYAGDSGGTGTERMRIDSSGRLMIGTTTEGGQFADDLTIANSGHTGITIRSGTDNVGSLYFSDGTSGDDEYRGAVQYNHTSNFLRFYSDAAERMRIQSDGDVLIGTTSGVQNGRLEVRSDKTSASTVTFANTNASYVGTVMLLHAERETTNNSYEFIGCRIESPAPGVQAFRLEVGDDGDVRNVNGSYGTISDISLKENIVDANSQWDDFKNLKFRSYNYKESTGFPTHKQIGVVAQEAETVCPNLVQTGREDENTKETHKFVKTSILYMKGMKALQEAIAKIEVLETKVAALEAA
jgi:hypothetical protein